MTNKFKYPLMILGVFIWMASQASMAQTSNTNNKEDEKKCLPLEQSIYDPSEPSAPEPCRPQDKEPRIDDRQSALFDNWGICENCKWENEDPDHLICPPEPCGFNNFLRDRCRNCCEPIPVKGCFPIDAPYQNEDPYNEWWHSSNYGSEHSTGLLAINIEKDQETCYETYECNCRTIQTPDYTEEDGQSILVGYITEVVCETCTRIVPCY